MGNTAYDYVEVHGRSYLTCAVCLQPLTKGYSPCRLVKPVGEPDPHPNAKQALCRKDYWEQWAVEYGNNVPLPDIPDNVLAIADIPSLREELLALDPARLGDLGVLTGNTHLLERALQAAKNSDWVESVDGAFSRLSEKAKAPDVEMSAPLNNIEPTPAELALVDVWNVSVEEVRTKLANSARA